MPDVNYFKIADLPVVDAVPEGATVLAYNDGQLMRVNGENVGGGGKVVTIKMEGYDDYLAGIAPAAAAAPTFTCDTTFEEIVQMILTGKHFDVDVCACSSGLVMIYSALGVNYLPTASVPVVGVYGAEFTFYITADGVSTTDPNGK